MQCCRRVVGVRCACSRREVNYTTKRRFENTTQQNVQLNYLHTAEMISVAVNGKAHNTHSYTTHRPEAVYEFVRTQRRPDTDQRQQ